MPLKQDDRKGDRHRSRQARWRQPDHILEQVRKRAAIRGVPQAQYVEAALRYYWSRVGADGSEVRGPGLLDPQNPDCYSDDGKFTGWDGDDDTSGYDFVAAEGDTMPRPGHVRSPARVPRPRPVERRSVEPRRGDPVPRSEKWSLTAGVAEADRLLREADAREREKFIRGGGDPAEWPEDVD
jgi:hypothetical protein